MAQVTFEFLDVGQGDGTVVALSNGQVILVDLGSKKNADIAGVNALVTLAALLAAARIVRHSNKLIIDYLFLTHGDGDHYNLLPTFLRGLGDELDISNVLIGGSKSDYSDEIQNLLLTPAENLGRLTLFENSDHDAMNGVGNITPRWRLMNNTVNIYLLSANYQYRDIGPKNPKSIVLMVEYYGNKVILTGDAEEATEQEIIGYYAANPAFLRSFGLKLGHHGSLKGSSAAWIQAVRPQAVFASSDMRWAHPYCETIDRVMQSTALKNLYPHQWICGRGAGENKEYMNHKNEAGCYMTMAYITEQKTQQVEENTWYLEGLVQGVQYELKMFDNGTMQMQDTLGGGAGPFRP
jgi:competence protein ComEC